VNPPQEGSASQIRTAFFGLKNPFNSQYSKRPGGIRPIKNLDFETLFDQTFWLQNTIKMIIATRRNILKLSQNSIFGFVIYLAVERKEVTCYN
jgi:hypothetical protein